MLWSWIVIMWYDEANEFLIRPLQEGDKLDDLISLSREFFAEYEAHHEDFFAIDSLKDSDIIAYFSHWLDSDEGETFLALAADKIVGYITVYIREHADYWKVKRIGMISGLMVHQAYRRRGIAKRLLAAARTFFKQKDVRYFTVYTAVANQDALKFYEQSGLVPLYTTLIGQTDST